jgi:hypothetical protein
VASGYFRRYYHAGGGIMVEIHPGIFVGSDEDYLGLEKEYIPSRNIDQPINGWAVLHCCKEPYHRQFVGYRGRGAPRDYPEYFFAIRGDRMALNMIDAPSPNFFSFEMITAGLGFLFEKRCLQGKKLLIHCNLGISRGPSIAMLYINTYVKDAPRVSFEQAEAEMKSIYPAYNPGEGIRGHLRRFWYVY